VSKGNCEDETMTETESCSNEEQCLCEIEGIIYQPGEILDDECKYCQCKYGVMDCRIKNETTKFHPTCDETCYCVPETGAKVCVNASSECGEDPAQCNNVTHHQVPDPDRPCCMLCKPRIKPCEKKVEETKTFNFTHESYGLCVSPPLDVGKCEGGCGISMTKGEFYTVKRDGLEYPLFDLDITSDCACCQAQMTSDQVDFLCANQETVSIKVQQIGSCSCTKCE